MCNERGSPENPGAGIVRWWTSSGRETRVCPGYSATSSFPSIHGGPVLQVCHIITDTDGRLGRIKPVILVLGGRLDPYRIRGETLYALQAIDPILQHEIAVVQLPARPQLNHLDLEGRADFAVCFLLPVPWCQRGPLPIQIVVSQSTTACFKTLCFSMMGTARGRKW